MSRTRDRPWAIALAIIMIMALTIVFALALAASAQRGRGGGGGGARMGPSGGGFRGPNISPKMPPRGGPFGGQMQRPSGQIPQYRVAPRTAPPVGRYQASPQRGLTAPQFAPRYAPRYAPRSVPQTGSGYRRYPGVAPTQPRLRTQQPQVTPGTGAGPRVRRGTGREPAIRQDREQRRQPQPGITPGRPGRGGDLERRGPAILPDRSRPGTSTWQGGEGRRRDSGTRYGRDGRSGYGRVYPHDGRDYPRYRSPRYHGGRYYYDEGPFYGLSLFFGGWGFGLGSGWPYAYYSPFYSYGFPYFYTPRAVVVEQPVYTYTPVPMYGGYYLEQPRPSGLSQTIDDIRDAWRTSNVNLLRGHVDTNVEVAVYLNGVYSYSLPGQDYWNMVRDAMSRTRTINFVTTGLELRSDGAYELIARHDFYDANNSFKSVNVSYTLTPVGGGWIITGVGSAVPDLEQ